jgi:hypothetical protein
LKSRAPTAGPLLALIAFQLGVFTANATIEINFDTEADGNPIAALPFFIDTVRLAGRKASDRSSFPFRKPQLAQTHQAIIGQQCCANKAVTTKRMPSKVRGQRR